MSAELGVTSFSACDKNMITGIVDEDFKAIINLDFYNQFNKLVTLHKVFIDTGFNNDICMPAAEIRRLRL